MDTAMKPTDPQEASQLDAVGAPEKGGESDFTPITTQADLDRIVGDRLARERKKYADYSELKAKARKLDEVEHETSALLEEKQAELASTMEELKGLKTAQQVEAWKAHVAQDSGVPAGLLRGSTEEEIREHAKALQLFTKTGPVVPTGHMKPESSSDDVRSTVRKLFGHE